MNNTIHHILIADDEEGSAFFINRAFNKAGLTYTVSHIKDGLELIDYLTGEGSYQDRSLYPHPLHNFKVSLQERFI